MTNQVKAFKAFVAALEDSNDATQFKALKEFMNVMNLSTFEKELMKDQNIEIIFDLPKNLATGYVVINELAKIKLKTSKQKQK